MADLTDDELIPYCRLHSQTERALFHSSHVARLLRLAGREEAASSWDKANCFRSLDLTDLCDEAVIHQASLRR